MFRYIVFQGPPSPQLCIEATQDPSAWHNKLKPGQSPWTVLNVGRDELHDAVMAMRQQQHDPKGKRKVAEKLQSTMAMGTQQDMHTESQADEVSAAGPSSKRRRAVAFDDTEYDGDDVWDVEGLSTRLHGLHPPPTQDSMRFTQQFRPVPSFQHQDSRATLLPSGSMLVPSQYLQSQFDETCDSVASVGPPPRFAWSAADLVPFNEFRKVLRSHTGRYKPSVSFLAAIVDVRDARTVSTGKQVAEWDLIDQTGQVVKMSIWGSGADDVTALVRRGDIVFVDHAKLSEHNNVLQMSVNHDRGQSLKGWGLQIVWRTNVSDPEDYQHRFDEGLRGQGLSQVDLVLEFVDWYLKWKG
ncbi:hypothetical protein ACM66B_005069 [Microbotryomycetes sp. NB124-2]